jgi:anthranilate synthase/aminodeoxychorismate synthase-like glutamine amidotransferase
VIELVDVLIIDNFDSFVYNLYQYTGELGAKVSVLRSNVSLNEIEKEKPGKIIISPGPGRPDEAGISIEAVKSFSKKIPILGVCLGHQAIGAAFGARIAGADKLLHGKTSMIEHDGKAIFKGVKNPFIATRYHSLVISKTQFPEEIQVTAKTTDDGTIMGVRHRELPLFGVQFHPESIFTSEGKKIIKNFLDL